MVTISYAPHHSRRTLLRSLTWNGHSDLHDGQALLRLQTTSTRPALLRLLVLDDEGRSDKDVTLQGVLLHFSRR